MKTTYKGYEIAITDAMTFVVSGPDWPEGMQSFDSVVLAKAAIEDHVKGVVRVKRAEVKLAIPVLVFTNTHGKGLAVQRVKVKGIHAGTSAVTFDPPTDISTGFSQCEIMPDLDWIEGAMRERNELLTKARLIEQKLQPFSVREKRGWGRIDVARYPAVVGQLEKDLAKARTAAIEYAVNMSPNAD